MKHVIIAGVLMFLALSLVGCGRSEVVEDEGIEAAGATIIVDTVNWDLYTTCVNGQEFMVMSGRHKGNVIQVLDAQGYPKQCKEK